jgi:hypothetical protein
MAAAIASIREAEMRAPSMVIVSVMGCYLRCIKYGSPRFNVKYDGKEKIDIDPLDFESIVVTREGNT